MARPLIDEAKNKRAQIQKIEAARANLLQFVVLLKQGKIDEYETIFSVLNEYDQLSKQDRIQLIETLHAFAAHETNKES